MRLFSQKNTSPLPADAIEQEIACSVLSISETGPSRSTNEDAILFLYPGGYETLFAMVADGMGGHNAGEIASDIACTTARSYITTHYSTTEANALMSGVVHAANKAIISAADGNAAYSGMGTTATMLLISNGKMHFAQVGDSRLYIHREGVLTQCTTDQTLVNNMLNEGKITAEEAGKHPLKHVLTQALGSTNQVQPVLSEKAMPVVVGDRFLICSDGVYEILKQEELEFLMALKKSEFVIECIKALCMQRKASDNFSVILVDIKERKSAGQSVQNSVPITKEQNVLL